jgi:hypothetical protein
MTVFVSLRTISTLFLRSGREAFMVESETVGKMLYERSMAQEDEWSLMR